MVSPGDLLSVAANPLKLQGIDGNRNVFAARRWEASMLFGKQPANLADSGASEIHCVYFKLGISLAVGMTYGLWRSE
jgi:hypothetical protein